MREALVATDLETDLASGATYRRINLPGNDCEWVDSSARQLIVASVQLDDAEPVAARLLVEGWAVRR